LVLLQKPDRKPYRLHWWNNCIQVL